MRAQYPFRSSTCTSVPIRVWLTHSLVYRGSARMNASLTFTTAHWVPSSVAAFFVWPKQDINPTHNAKAMVSVIGNLLIINFLPILESKIPGICLCKLLVHSYLLITVQKATDDHTKQR